MAYFTHGIQAIILSQNQVNFYTQWGYTDAVEGAAAVSLAITATGFGKMLTVWLGGEFSDRIGRKKMAVAGGVLYIICFAGLLFTASFPIACVCAFLSGAATSGFWDASLVSGSSGVCKPRIRRKCSDRYQILRVSVRHHLSAVGCAVLSSRKLAHQHLDPACYVHCCGCAGSDRTLCL